ncbi:MAG: magnesium transporter CorA family protein [Rubrivivax sp.]|nr:magnesium transporter CorA family protein [Rubrivivax sp.]
MRVFHVAAERFEELGALPAQLPAQGFLWVGSARREFEVGHADVQAALERWGQGTLVELHVSDLVNNQLPSHYDYTSWYDLMVFRRLATVNAGAAVDPLASTAAQARRVLQSIDTSPVGFAVFDRVLLTVHPTDCAVREHFASRYLGLATAAPEQRGTTSRLPTSAADLMLRMVNHMVDGYLELRRLLTRQLGTLQQELLDPKSRFADWSLLLDSRNALHLLEDICEDQRAAVQEWIDAMDEWPAEDDAARRRERELLRVRSRDVLEHVERVLQHVRRLEASAESAVQMHFSALSHRTNDIMRTLTALTAVFLPLNLITGFFGMNFEFMPLIHTHLGFWLAVLMMALLGVGLAFYFRSRHYLGAASRR